jgi:hypothetical protein
MVLTFNSIDINGTIKPFKAIAIDIDSDLAGVEKLSRCSILN